MRNLILTALATSFGFSLFAQGTVIFDNTSLPRTHIYAPLPSNPHLSLIGNGPNDNPPGSVNWAGVGTNGFTTVGPAAFAQLLGAPGYNAPESALQPSGSPPTSFHAGPIDAGEVIANTATFNNIPAGAPQATLEMVAWDNSTGLYPTWSQASVAWLMGVLAAGRSGTWNQDNLGGAGINPPPMINSTDHTQYPPSFNLYYYVPEPTTAALAGLGAAALVILRRRKGGL
jgi:hypothetical protein